MRIPHFFWLLLLPLTTVLFAPPLYNWNGPLWLGKNLDPDYAYLMNSLTILNLSPPGHRDHPGTTVQTLGALVIRATHPTLSAPEITRNVLQDPEKYAENILRALAIACSALFFLSGLVMFQATASLWAAFAFQAVPLLSPLLWEMLPRLTPDLLTLALTSVLTALVCRAWLLGVSSTLQLGGTFGAVMASKITGLPVLILPFWLFRKNRRRLSLFLGASLAAFLIFTIPIWGRGLGFFAKWIWTVGVHDGTHGGGLVGLPAPIHWLSAAWKLCLQAPVFSFSILSAFALLLIPSENSNRKLRQLAALGAVALVAQLFMVAKHPSPRYLLPGYAFSGLIAALGLLRIKKPVFRQLLAISLTATAIFLPLHLLSGHGMQARSGDIARFALETRNCRVVPFYRSSSIPFALWFGNNFTKLNFTKELEKLYPDFYVYSLFWQVFVRFDGTQTTPAELAARGSSWCLWGAKPTLLETPPTEGMNAQPLWTAATTEDALFRLNFTLEGRKP